jgi:hypothetical protein
MQNQLPAAQALLSQKTANLDVLSNRKSGNLVGYPGKRQCIQFTLHLPQNIRFGLLRVVTYRHCHSRHPSRGIPQTFHGDQLAADDNLIKRQLPAN